MNKRLIVPVIILLTVFNFLLIPISADPVSVFGGEELEIPEDFAFFSNVVCSGHEYFLQATAHENGSFIICSHHRESDGPSENTFKQQYVDFYDSSGQFVKEFSFYTTQNYVAELTQDSIVIYFYAYAVVIDLNTEEIRCFDIPDSYVADQAAYDALRQEEFTSGNWTYSCKKAITGYHQLVRSNGDTTQVLIDMPGLGLGYLLGIVGAVIASIACVVLSILIGHRKRANNV